MSKRFYTLTILSAVALFGAGCTNNSGQNSISSDSQTELSSPSQLVFVKKEGAVSHYTGEAVVSGSYSFNEFGFQICFKSDTQSQTLIPSKDNEFCFENSEEAAQGLYKMSIGELVQAAGKFSSDPRDNPYMIPKPARVRISGYKEYAGAGEGIYASDGTAIDLSAGAGTDLSIFVELVEKQQP